MAFGFLKKVFSFGKKQVEEVPAEGEAPSGTETPVGDAAAPEAPQPASPAPDAAPVEKEGAQAEEAHFEAPEVPEFLRRPKAPDTPEPAPEVERPAPEVEPPSAPEAAPETWDAPEPEDRAAPETPVAPEPPEPAPVPEVPIETPDAPREVPPEPVAREIPEEAEPTPAPRPEPEKKKPVARKPEPAPAKPEAPAPEPAEEPEPDSRAAAEDEPAKESVPPEREPVAEAVVPKTPATPEETEAAEVLPEPPVETPDAPHAADVEDDARAAEPAPDVERTPMPDEAAFETEAAPPAEPVEEAAAAPPAAGRVSVGKTVERKVEAAPEPAAPEPRRPWFQRLREGLSRSSKELRDSISGVVTKRRLDEDTLQDLEDVLLRADLGIETAMRVTDALASGRYGRDVSDEEVRGVMAEEMQKVLTPVALPLELDLSHRPHVILVVGVNGTGKTTTIGKLAAKLKEGGLSVTLAAGDTFRAAAIEQLKIWGERTGSPVVASKLGADAAGLAWDAYEKAKQDGSDVLIIDTAGRLQNKAELMAELEKIVRVLGKHDPEAPHTVLQTVDATTGQNALNQVEIFRNIAGVNGLVMTKLDGTARGGILVAIAAKHKLPVYFIGVGEQVDDLEPFSASDFAKAIAGVE